MRQQIFYRYLGTNGIIDSPVYLEGIYSVKTIRLIADEGSQLTKDGVHFVKSARLVNESELGLWREVKDNSR